MMLTAKGRYAVMAMVDIALHGSHKPTNLQEISLRQGITVPYLEQIFCKLKGSELVESVRGPGGGYRLARAKTAITIADIVHAAEEPIRMTRCEKTSESGCMQSNSKCLTHDLWDGLGNSIHAYLQSVTLQHICDKHAASTPDMQSLGCTG